MAHSTPRSRAMSLARSGRSAVDNLRVMVRAARQPALRDAVPGVQEPASLDLGARARSLFDEEQFDDVEYVLWEVLRNSPRAPSATYLLGLSMLFNGKLREGRRMIERAYALRHWLDDRVKSPRVFDMLDEVEAEFPEWEWPRYQRYRERWRAVGLDLGAAIDHLVQTTPSGLRFVQIGANDGKSGDPLRAVIRRHGMAGLFVEPQPEPISRLQERYRDVSGLRFAQVAIAEEDGLVTLVTDPTRTTLGTLVPDRNIMRNRADAAVSMEVEGCTFRTLTKRFEIDSFDVLQLDTEGYDYRILKQVELRLHDLKIVNMEYYCLPVAERLASAEMLEASGFALFFGSMDLLAVRRDHFGDRFAISQLGVGQGPGARAVR